MLLLELSMKRLIILDHETDKVHVYHVNNPDSIDEEYISNLGFNLNNCNWMAGKFEVIKHKGILK